MAINSIAILVTWMVFYILLRSTRLPLLADALTFLTFIFAFIVSDKQFSAFYLLLFMAAAVMDLSTNTINLQAKGNTAFKGIMLSLAIGLGLYMVIVLIGNAVGGNIVGIPNFQISSPQQIAQAFQPTFVSALGIVENRIAFAIFALLNAGGMLIPLIGVAFKLMPIVFPAFLIGIMMGIFHVAAYGISTSLILWASMAFTGFIITTYILKDSLAADFAHYLNNGVQSIKPTLQVVGL